MAYKGKCSNCERNRETVRVVRHGGGDWRRAGRYYDTSICVECLFGLEASAIEAKERKWNLCGGPRYTANSILRAIESERKYQASH